MPERIDFLHISKIEPGDTVMHNGKKVTVGKADLKTCPFMGLSLFGDTYNLGQKLVQRVTFERVFPSRWEL